MIDKFEVLSWLMGKMKLLRIGVGLDFKSFFSL